MRTAAALIILVATAVPGTVLHLLGGMLRGSVQDIRTAAEVVVSWDAGPLLGYLSFVLATTGVAGTMLVCWMAAGMTVIRVIAELT